MGIFFFFCLVCLVVRRCGVLLVLLVSFSSCPGMFLEIESSSSDCFVTG